MNNFIWPIRVYYEDTNMVGRVYYANYLKFMERACTELLRDKGIEQTELKQQHNLIFVIRQVTIDYLKPAFFNDLLNVTVNMTKLGKASMTMVQQVLRESDILCQGTVKIAAIDVVSQRPKAIPLDIVKMLNAKLKR
ncbi:MAG: tol-pal system-associated acyl-CoA thioesterase [Thiomargarita sp.]|nr:tol-pal system-associated acyl-CoA thioesterase [Thiomargarita sp.]